MKSIIKLILSGIFYNLKKTPKNCAIFERMQKRGKQRMRNRMRKNSKKFTSIINSLFIPYKIIKLTIKCLYSDVK